MTGDINITPSNSTDDPENQDPVEQLGSDVSTDLNSDVSVDTTDPTDRTSSDTIIPIGDPATVNNDGSVSASLGKEYFTWKYENDTGVDKNTMRLYAAENGLRCEKKGGEYRLVNTKGEDITAEHNEKLTELKNKKQQGVDQAVGKSYESMLRNYIAAKNLEHGHEKYSYKDGKVTRADGKPFDTKKFKKFCQSKENREILVSDINKNLRDADPPIVNITAKVSQGIFKTKRSAKIIFKEVKIKMIGDVGVFDGEKIIAAKASLGNNWDFRNDKSARAMDRNIMRRYAAKNGLKYKNGELFKNGENVTAEHGKELSAEKDKEVKKVNSAITRANSDFLQALTDPKYQKEKDIEFKKTLFEVMQKNPKLRGFSYDEKTKSVVRINELGEKIPMSKKDAKEFNKIINSKSVQTLKATIVNDSLRKEGILNVTATVKHGKLKYSATKVKILNQTSMHIDGGIMSVAPMKGTHWKFAGKFRSADGGIVRSAKSEAKNVVRKFAEANGKTYKSEKDIPPEDKESFEKFKSEYEDGINSAIKQGFDSFKVDFAKNNKEFVYVDKEGNPIKYNDDGKPLDKDGNIMDDKAFQERIKGGKLMKAGEPPKPVDKNDLKNYKKYEKDNNAQLQRHVNNSLQANGYQHISASVFTKSRFLRKDKQAVKLASVKVKFVGETGFFNGKSIVPASPKPNKDWDFASDKDNSAARKNATLLYAQEKGLKYKNGKLYDGKKDVTSQHTQGIEEKITAEKGKISDVIKEVNKELMEKFAKENPQYKFENGELTRSGGRKMMKADRKAYKDFEMKENKNGNHEKMLNAKFAEKGMNVVAEAKTGLFKKHKGFTYKTARIKLIGSTSMTMQGGLASVKPAKGQHWDYAGRKSTNISHRNAMKLYANENGLKYKNGELYAGGKKVTKQHADGVNKKEQELESKMTDAMQQGFDSYKADYAKNSGGKFVFVDKDGKEIKYNNKGQQIGEDGNPLPKDKQVQGGRLMRAGNPPMPLSDKDIKQYQKDEKKADSQLNSHMSNAFNNAGISNVTPRVKKGAVKLEKVKIKFLGKTGFYDGTKISTQDPIFGTHYNFAKDKYAKRNDKNIETLYKSQGKGKSLDEFKKSHNDKMDAAIKAGFEDFKKDFIAKHDKFKLDNDGNIINKDGSPLTKQDAKLYAKFEKENSSQLESHVNASLSKAGIQNVSATVTKGKLKYKTKEVVMLSQSTLFNGKAIETIAAKRGVNWEYSGKKANSPIGKNELQAYAKSNGYYVKDKQVYKQGNPPENMTSKAYEDITAKRTEREEKIERAINNAQVTMNKYFCLENPDYVLVDKKGNLLKQDSSGNLLKSDGTPMNEKESMEHMQEAMIMRKPKNEGEKPQRMRKKDYKKFKTFQNNHRDLLSKQISSNLAAEGLKDINVKVDKKGIKIEAKKGPGLIARIKQFFSKSKDRNIDSVAKQNTTPYPLEVRDRNNPYSTVSSTNDSVNQPYSSVKSSSTSYSSSSLTTNPRSTQSDTTQNSSTKYTTTSSSLNSRSTQSDISMQSSTSNTSPISQKRTHQYGSPESTSTTSNYQNITQPIPQQYDTVPLQDNTSPKYDKVIQTSQQTTTPYTSRMSHKGSDNSLDTTPTSHTGSYGQLPPGVKKGFESDLDVTSNYTPTNPSNGMMDQINISRSSSIVKCASNDKIPDKPVDTLTNNSTVLIAQNQKQKVTEDTLEQDRPSSTSTQQLSMK